MSKKKKPNRKPRPQENKNTSDLLPEDNDEFAPADDDFPDNTQDAKLCPTDEIPVSQQLLAMEMAKRRIKDEMMASPKKIYSYLDERVYGHDKYKRELSLLLWKAYHHKSPGGALLVAGPSGCGKTEMLRRIAPTYGNIVIVDGTSIVATGYKGSSKLSTHLANLRFADNAPYPIYCIDEFDKLLHKTTSNGGWSDSGLLYEMLKLLEGCTINIGSDSEPRIVDTTNVYFILLGSFSALTDIKKTAPIGFDRTVEIAKPTVLSEETIMNLMPPELQGRIEQSVILEPFTEEDYKKIIAQSLTRAMNNLHIPIDISDEKLLEITHNAFESKTGVRYMNNEINKYVNNILFDNPEPEMIYIK